MRNKKAAAIMGVAAVALVGGTFAYFTQTSVIDNPFDTGKYSTVVTEDFKPTDGEDWEPGVEVNKDLYVHNTGDRNVVVRVKFEDIWSRGGDQFKYVDGQHSSTIEQPDQYDGETDSDLSVVHKYFENEDKWSSLQNDGYYYLKAPLAPGENTDTFLSSVRLLDTVDMGKIRTKYYYTTAETMPEITDDMEGWEEQTDWMMPGEGTAVVRDEAKHTAAITRPIENKLGYSDADYTLRITVETVQATDKAVKEAFKDNYDEEIYKAWNLDKEDLETASSEAPEETDPEETTPEETSPEETEPTE